MKIDMRYLILTIIAAFFWQGVACARIYDEDTGIIYGGNTSYNSSRFKTVLMYDMDTGKICGNTYARTIDVHDGTVWGGNSSSNPVKVPKVTVIYENKTFLDSPGGHTAIRVGGTVYDLQKRGLVDQRNYSDVLNDNRGQREVEINFLSSPQIEQLEMNLINSVGDKISYQFLDNNCTNFVKDQFGKIGVSFPNNVIDTPHNLYKQTIQMNKIYVTPTKWRNIGRQFGTTSFDLQRNFIKGIAIGREIMGVSITPIGMPSSTFKSIYTPTPIIEPIKIPSYINNPAFPSSYNPLPSYNFNNNWR